MKTRVRAAGLAVALFGAAVPAVAGFHASDLIYVPVVAHLAGAEDSLWRSDLFITNADTVAIDVAMVYLPSGMMDNSPLFDTRDAWLGGREEEGFGKIDEALADIPPNGTVVLRDVVGEYFSDQLGLTGKGALVVFAYEAGTLDNADGRVFRNAVVYSRTYNETSIWVPDPDNEGAFIQQEASYGQIIPGVPWYDTADIGAIDESGDLSYELLLGGEESETYRYNVGILNASDPQTSITLAIELFDGAGEQISDQDGIPVQLTVFLPPLAHVQYDRLLSESFNLTAASDVLVRVRFISANTTSPDPIPAFTSYGSVAEAHTSDPTTILPSFGFPYDVDCMWGTPSTTKSAPAARPRQRALEIPSR